jgi:hypothetical protein
MVDIKVRLMGIKLKLALLYYIIGALDGWGRNFALITRCASGFVNPIFFGALIDRCASV